MRAGRRLATLVALVTGVALAGCDSTALAPRETTVTPQARPAAAPAPRPAPVPEPRRQSLKSKDLETYYARLQSDLLSRGLLRTDGGGPDTPVTDTMLVRNFETIALGDEYVRGAGLRRASAALGAVKKWTKPVRMAAEFGPSVPEAQAQRDEARLAVYARRVSRVSGHPIQMVSTGANFHVLFMSEDDTDLIAPRIKQIVPNVSQSTLAIFDDLPRETHCLVMAFSDTPGGYDYGTAIAVIRSEHPDLLRRSCIHEEIAQGMGLGNDDPRARPSIFNDDDEFALLTRHDEMLLKILYDPRLRPGMGAQAARPVVRELATQLVGLDANS